MYKKSVIQFKPLKYIAVSAVFKSILSFDHFQYICKICDRKMLKRKIRCLAVGNKLEIFNLPENFLSVRILGRVLVAKRILFKKVAIMSKRQSPKIRGSVSNIPVENLVNNYIVLPVLADSNGLIIVKLKRRIQYKSHVIFEFVRPYFLKSLLLSLKEKNFQYNDI